jgi:hypothetical protein
MTNEKKQGFWARLFGTKKSGCCDMKVEEITEDQPENKTDKKPISCCCCGDDEPTTPKKKDSKTPTGGSCCG